MAKGLRVFIILAFSLLCVTASYGQEKKYNPLAQPLSVIKRLSYENFKDIKMLQVAVLNYGAGETDIDRLVDQYAEASALYFQGKIDEAANLFTDNSREIQKVVQQVVRKYKEDANKIIVQGIKLNIKSEFARSLKGERKEEKVDEYLSNARFSLAKAEDLYTGFIDNPNSPPSRLISAIYMYRRCKENVFLVFQYLDMAKDQKDQLLAGYKKDVIDNQNKVYKSMEKQN